MGMDGWTTSKVLKATRNCGWLNDHCNCKTKVKLSIYEKDRLPTFESNGHRSEIAN